MFACLCNRVLLSIVMLLYAPLILVVVGLLCWGAVAFSRFAVSALTYPGGAWLAVIALLVDLTVLGVSLLLVVGLIPLLFRIVFSEVDGIALLPSQHPKLFALIDRF